MIIGVYLVAAYLMRGALAISRITSGSIPLYIVALAGLIAFLIFFGYFTDFELLVSGRTPGKRVVGLRVVRDGGYTIDFYASLVRNLVRLVDMLPATYVVGIISIFFS